MRGDDGHQDLTGYYTYRSFLNRQDPADDFNTIRFGQGELFLWSLRMVRFRARSDYPSAGPNSCRATSSSSTRTA